MFDGGPVVRVPHWRPGDADYQVVLEPGVVKCGGRLFWKCKDVVTGEELLIQPEVYFSWLHHEWGLP